MRRGESRRRGCSCCRCALPTGDVAVDSDLSLKGFGLPASSGAISAIAAPLPPPAGLVVSVGTVCNCIGNGVQVGRKAYHHAHHLFLFTQGKKALTKQCDFQVHSRFHLLAGFQHTWSMGEGLGEGKVLE